MPNELISFFFDPYQSAPLLNILLEAAAAILGIASVFFARKENILVYPTGIASTGIYVYLLSQWALYGDLIINIYYTLMSIYGWYMWSKIIDGSQEHIKITRMDSKDKLKTFGIFVFSSAFVVVVYRYYGIMSAELGLLESVNHVIDKIAVGRLQEFREITPYLDTFTTGAAFAAMWLMANKKIENWVFWIAVNVVSVPLYFVKGYGFTGVQYTIFLVLAIFGYIEWGKRIREQNKNIQ
jgi:nicotinamide mononucleotide transporter